MERKRNNVIFIMLLMLVAWVFSIAEARAIKNSTKFDFPKHLEGSAYFIMNELAPYMKYNPVDLGLDVMDNDIPEHIRATLTNLTLSGSPDVQQYTDHEGHPRLRKAIAQLYSKVLNQDLDPDHNILVTPGATGAVYDAIMGHTSEGDEWVLIEPAYTMYVPMIKQARGVPRFSSLKLAKGSDEYNASNWKLDRKELESLFSNKTKAIIINNPINPIGKVYTYEELLFIAKLAKKWNTLIVCDEAHEWSSYKPFIRIASLPGMFERTITIGSASKTFGVGGWRLGWAYGPTKLLENIKAVQYRSVDSCPTPLQEALAFGFEEEYRNYGKPHSYFATRLEKVRDRRNFMVNAFNNSGMKAIVPEGGYCLFAKWSTLKNLPISPGKGSSMRFLKWSIENIRVLGLPGATYYGEKHKPIGEHYLRYCFNKKQETLNIAAERLQKLRKYL